ncbi:MAG: hypothetical protein ACREQE_09105, partial [Candidatus Binataceae bacterium]
MGYAMLVKLCDDAPGPKGRYNSTDCIGTRKDRIDRKQSRCAPRLHAVHGTSELHHADADAPLHS